MLQCRYLPLAGRTTSAAGSASCKGALECIVGLGAVYASVVIRFVLFDHCSPVTPVRMMNDNVLCMWQKNKSAGVCIHVYIQRWCNSAGS